jgi:hypothetical protein
VREWESNPLVCDFISPHINNKSRRKRLHCGPLVCNVQRTKYVIAAFLIRTVGNGETSLHNKPLETLYDIFRAMDVCNQSKLSLSGFINGMKLLGFNVNCFPFFQFCEVMMRTLDSHLTWYRFVEFLFDIEKAEFILFNCDGKDDIIATIDCAVRRADSVLLSVNGGEVYYFIFHLSSLACFRHINRFIILVGKGVTVDDLLGRESAAITLGVSLAVVELMKEGLLGTVMVVDAVRIEEKAEVDEGELEVNACGEEGVCRTIPSPYGDLLSVLPVKSRKTDEKLQPGDSTSPSSNRVEYCKANDGSSNIGIHLSPMPAS